MSFKPRCDVINEPHDPTTAEDDDKVIMNMIKLFVARGPKGENRNPVEDVASSDALILMHHPNNPT